MVLSESSRVDRALPRRAGGRRLDASRRERLAGFAARLCQAVPWRKMYYGRFLADEVLIALSSLPLFPAFAGASSRAASAAARAVLARARDIGHFRSLPVASGQARIVAEPLW